MARSDDVSYTCVVRDVPPSGISAAKTLAENGVEDIVILEATDRIGGRIRKEVFGGVSVELGAGWIVGVGGKVPNPVWELATKSSLRTCFSDYSNARYNIYDRRSDSLSSFTFEPVCELRIN